MFITDLGLLQDLRRFLLPDLCKVEDKIVKLIRIPWGKILVVIRLKVKYSNILLSFF